jgi:hypothetical protein
MAETLHVTHMGRSWSGSELEDECPCPKAPCGLVPSDTVDPKCDQHAPERCKTMRQVHSSAVCRPRTTVRYIVDARWIVNDHEKALRLAEALRLMGVDSAVAMRL